MDDVQVHYNSSKPAEVQALVYTQGTEIHVGPGQEQHLAHEVWHVVQQKEGKVKPTLQAKGVAINDDEGLEKEANEMGARANHVSGGSLPRKEASGFDSLVKTPNVNPFAKSILSRRDTISKSSTIVQRMPGLAPLPVLAFAVLENFTSAEAQFAWLNSPTDILLLVVSAITNVRLDHHLGNDEVYRDYMRDLNAVRHILSTQLPGPQPQRAGAVNFVNHLRQIIHAYLEMIRFQQPGHQGFARIFYF